MSDEWFDMDIDEWNNLFNENIREDGLVVHCSLTGETYLKEVDAISSELTFTAIQGHKEVEFTYHVADNDSGFDKEFFIKQHGDTLKEHFNEEQIDFITNRVKGTVENHINFIAPVRISNEEYELATEYFGATDLEVLKAKIVKQPDNTLKSITTIDYQDEKYILNLDVKKADCNFVTNYLVDINSLNIDSKDNIAFKEKVESNFTLPILRDNFDMEGVYKDIKDNLDNGITKFKEEQRVDKKRGHRPPNVVDFD